MKKLILILLVAVLVFPDLKAQPTQNFIHASGADLEYGVNNTKINLRGINFNDFWLEDTLTGNWLIDDPNDLGTPRDTAFGGQNYYNDANQVGFNTIRTAMNYRQFEDNSNPYVYKQSGWNFIDQNITWANQYNMFLIIDLHIPQGGLQNAPNAPNLWTNTSNQDRLVALWYNIAQRYKNDTIIAAYDILNEPTPVDSIQAWSNLAQRIVDTIRTIDQNHLIIVEYAYGIIDVNSQWYPFWDLNQQMFFVNDNNVMYDFHYYNPLAYTLQCYNDPNCTPTIQYNDPLQTFVAEGAAQATPFNQTWLATDLAGMMSVYQSANVPINIGEWAPWRANYEYNNNQMQGYEYICDLMNLFDQNNLNWQYYCYEEFRPTANDPKGNNGLNERLRNYLLFNQCVPGNTVSIEENSVSEPITIYPNPVKRGENITINFDVSGNYNIKIIDMMGRTIQNFSLKSKSQINTNDLNSGIYLIVLENENDERIETQKLILE
jgi:Cellulase (glycosyl hydrolase family 5)/Secretion system C-terminal sorting domain